MDRALLFVRDTELGVLIPASGFPQTVRGKGWSTLLAACTAPGRREAMVWSVDGQSSMQVVAHTVLDGTTLVLLGGDADAGKLSEVLLGLPLLAAALHAQASGRVAEGRAVLARQAGQRAESLARALDATRKELEGALGDAASLNRQLQQADQRKDDFIAMLGHELRNPMAAISSALEVMRASEGKAGGGSRAREIIARQSRQLSRLVDDLLDVARITSGKITLRRDTLNLNDVVLRAIDTVRSLLDRKRHTLTVAQAEPIWISADPVRIEQIFVNLLTNAAKYTDSGGDIRVTIRSSSERAIATIEDSGIGIAPEFVDKIFDSFVQLSPALDRAQGGMGIGLTLVKHLTLLHGGEVHVKSELGKGSSFELTFPALSEAPMQLVADARPSRVTALRVLIVDDNQDSVEMIAELVELWGHEVRHALDGVTGLEQARDFTPDVVILDIGLPGIDGYEVARRLRDMESMSSKRIIALSGYGMQADRERSMAAGFDGHLVKPVDLAVLREVLSSGT